jgi:hypothetical protein
MPSEKESKELEEITGAPVLINHKGKSYELHPLGVSAMSMLRRWAKDRIVTGTKENVELLKRAGAPEAIITEIWEDAHRQLSDPLISPEMESPEAINHWIFLSLRKANPDITEEEVQEIVDDKGVKELMMKLMELNGITLENLENPQIEQQLKLRRNKIGL